MVSDRYETKEKKLKKREYFDWTNLISFIQI